MAPVWTSALDKQLTELHGRKLNLKFMARWLRRPTADIVSRLAELGLAMRKAPPRPTATPRRAAHRPSSQAAPHPTDVPRRPVHPPVADRREPTFAHSAQLRDAYLDDMASASRLAIDRSDDDDDADHLPTAQGCSPGHLMPEARIAALYHALTRDYR